MSEPERPWKARSGQKIQKLYAWVAQEPDGGEGIIALTVPGIGVTPAIGADRDRIESYRAQAQQAAHATGFPVRLKVFGTGTVIEEL